MNNLNLVIKVMHNPVNQGNAVVGTERGIELDKVCVGIFAFLGILPFAVYVMKIAVPLYLHKKPWNIIVPNSVKFTLPFVPDRFIVPAKINPLVNGFNGYFHVFCHNRSFSYTTIGPLYNVPSS